MKTTLKTEITVADICDGFVYNQLEGKGLYGLGGKLTIQPEYQRNYIYADGGGKKEAAVIHSLLKGVSARTDLLQQSRGGRVRGARRSAAHHQYRAVRYEQVRDYG